MSFARSSVALLFLISSACGDEVASDPAPSRGVGTSPLPAIDPEGRLSDAPPSCDPVGLVEALEPTPENIARALQQECFHSGDGRRKLVIAALCERDLACGEKSNANCASDYEQRWQQRLRPRGLSVPCADALLDAMSCLAQAQCEDTSACDEADERADTLCDPNNPLPGSPMCPPLAEGRAPTKGPIPQGAINAAGMLDLSRVPDFIPALDRQGAIAGYVRYCGLRGGGAIPVYADDLQAVVGYMVPDRGFVPGPLP